MNSDFSAILERSLKEIESLNNVKICFVCEVGSRVYGWNSPNSDFDIKFIYIPHISWYLMIDDPKKNTIDYEWKQEERKDSSESSPKDEQKSGELPSITFHGWELGKALKFLRSSNPGFIEWLYSPIIYLERADFLKHAQKLAQESLTRKSVVHHYLSIAVKHHKLYFDGKTKSKWKKYF